MQFRNNDPQGDLVIVGIGFVAAGDTFEATGSAEEHFAALPDEFPRADKKATSTAAVASAQSDS